MLNNIIKTDLKNINDNTDEKKIKLKLKMTEKYKLTYFPVMALGEPIRWLLSYGKLPFNDIRLSLEDWQIEKYKMPFGQVPVLEIDGKRCMHQSVAICRYIADLVQLTGNDRWENYEIDAIVETVSELRSKVSNYNKTNDESPEKNALRKQLFKETIPFYLSRLENGIQQGYYLANGKLSWADIYFAALLEYNNGVLKEDIIDETKYPKLDILRNHVRNIPEIQQWLAKRPHSEY